MAIGRVSNTTKDRPNKVKTKNCFNVIILNVKSFIEFKLYFELPAVKMQQI